MTERKKCFYIDGGAGRVIAAIPALEKYAKKNPDKDFVVAIPGWDFLVWGNQHLQDRTYGIDTKGLFDNVLQHCDIISPEPYRLWEYFHQKISLIEGFDQIINETNDHSDLTPPKLYLSKSEEKNAANILAGVKQAQKKDKTIVIQPFGRGIRKDGKDVIDDASRSIDPQSYLALCKKLSTKYNLVLFAEQDFFLEEDNMSAKLQMDLRMWAAVIEASDYFVGCDSVGQHMARAFNKPGTVIIGSTYPINTSYPDYFQIWENKDVEKKYSPIRICGLDSQLADRYNDKVMDLDDKKIDEIFKMIVNGIEKGNK